MKFGIFSNGQRIKDPRASYKDDLREIVTADQCGFEECWISEHTGQAWLPYGVASTELLIAKAAGVTEKIRFGPAVRRIALYPPQMTAIEGAMCDVLTEGRYNFGFGVGPRVTNYEQWGLREDDAEAITLEALDFVMRAWSEKEPFDFEGQFFKGKNVALYPKPWQARIPVAVATGRSKILDIAAKNRFRILTTWTAGAAALEKIAQAFDDSCRRFAGGSRRQDIIASRAIYVADSDEKALSHVADDWRAHIEHSRRNLEPATAGLHLPGGGRSGLTFEDLMERGNIIVGSPATVTQQLVRLYNDVGGFGTLLVVMGRDVATNAQRDDMLRLFMESVAPKLSQLDAERGAAHEEADGRWAHMRSAEAVSA